MALLKTTGERVRHWRKHLGFNDQQDFADMVAKQLGREQYRASTISGIENNNIRPTGDVLLALAKIFDVSADYLLCLTDVDTPVNQLLEEGHGADGLYITPEADEAARLIDEINAKGQRAEIVQAVRLMIDLGNLTESEYTERLHGLLSTLDVKGRDEVLVVIYWLLSTLGGRDSNHLQ